MESLNGGGAEKVLINILKKLDYSKYAVDLCLIINKGVYIKEVPGEICLSYLFPNRFTFRIVKKVSSIIKSFLFFSLIVNHKIKKEYDIEISFLEGPTIKIHSLLKTKSKKITWVHCNLKLKRWWENLFTLEDAQIAYKSIDKIVFVSNDAMRQFNLLFEDIPAVKEVLYNPINKQEIIAKASHFPVTKSKLTLVSIGRLQPQKAFDRLLRVARKLKQDDLDFEIWIIGEGYLEKQLKALVSLLKLEENIKFLGFKENPYPYLNSADIFVNTSITEGFPLVIAEAICLGKAIVATDVTGSSEILDEGKYGMLTGHEDEDIYNALKEVMSNEGLRKELEKRALERSSMFDIDQSMKDFEEIINN